MEMRFVTLEDCADARGVVVVIDVCRAFTTAAYAFGAGAERILLAGTVDEALALRERFPSALIMGEVGGMPVDSFDLWNSPSQIETLDLAGKTLIQRTSSGTQGIVRSISAEHLLASSFAVAGATVRAIQAYQPREVTFVVTGAAAEDPRHGLEDRACAEYMAALLRGEPADPSNFMGWINDFLAVHRLDMLPEPTRSQFYADIERCRQPDRFAYALPVRRQAGLLIIDRS